MSTIDDPVIPDDLSALLRTGSRDLPASPAPLASIRGRAHRRRRRRRHLVAGGTAAVVLLVGLAVAQVTSRQHGGDRVVTATTPAVPEGSVAQPLLIRHTYQVDELPAGADLDRTGGRLDEVTASGASAWWTTEDPWYPASAFVLADGRRFGIATTNPLQPGEPAKARLDEIGADGTTVSSTSLPLEAPDGSSASIGAIGATGNELIVQRTIVTMPELDLANQVGDQPIEQTSSYAAIDVDTGVERPLPGPEDRAAAAAAGNTLVLAPGTDCTLVVTTLAGADRHTFDGGCGGTVPQLGGLANEIELSPDGRYLAGTWITIDMSGPGAQVLTVVDLDTGTVLFSRPLASSGVTQGMTWTGDRDLTVALRPDTDPVRWDGSGVSIRSIPWDAERATATATTGN